MALQRNRGDQARAPGRERGERAGAAPGFVRALITLVGLAVAGFLIWLATTFDLDATGSFWTAMALVAAAGFALGLSQLLGGWTKWGWPRFSPSVFLLAFLPALVLAGGILLAMKPTGDETDHVRGWAQDIGIEGLVNNFWTFPGLLAFTIGLVFAFCFDTSGPRTRVVGRDEHVRDEDVHDYRRDEPTMRTGDRDESTTPTGDTSVAEELRSREGRAGAVRADGREDRGEMRDPERRDTTP